MNQETFLKQQEALTKKVDDLDSANLPPANIIVSGIAGVGKSTLINAVFGKELAKTDIGLPVTDCITNYCIPGVPVSIWDTPGFELDVKKTEKTLKDIRQVIADKSASKDPFDRIHAIWYCVSSAGQRYQGEELKFIQSLHALGVPFVIVMTKCIDDMVADALEKVVNEVNRSNRMHDVDVVQILAKDYETRIGTIPSFGLNDLVNMTLKKLPEFIKGGFVAAQRVDVVLKRSLCEDIILHDVISAKNGFFDKIPLINIITTDYNIHKMLQKIGATYNTILGDEDIKRVTKGSHINLENVFSGLLNPFDMGYAKRLARFFDGMREKDGFKVDISHFTISERSARMIAFYGYTFVMSLEEIWNKSTEEELKNISRLINRIIDVINQKLDEIRRG